MSHFYLTLPSNSSMNYYPGNTLTHYVTKLHNTFNLQGNWEVGLSEIFFPRSWHNVGKNEVITLVYNDSNDVDAKQEDRSTEIIKIRRGYYESVESLLQEMNTLLMKTYREGGGMVEWNDVNDETASPRRRRQKQRPNFYYNKANRKVIVELGGRTELRFSAGLADMLGVDDDQNPLVNDKKRGASYKMKRVSDVDKTITSLYTYCDLLEHVPVGDTLAPLLRICDARGEYGKIVHLDFDKPRYIPVQKKAFDTIEIDIRDRFGIPIPFETGELVATLHFRRAKDSYFV